MSLRLKHYMRLINQSQNDAWMNCFLVKELWSAGGGDSGLFSTGSTTSDFLQQHLRNFGLQSFIFMLVILYKWVK